MGKKKPKPEQSAAKLRRQDAFLAAFAELGTVTAAAKASKVTRRAHQKWMQWDDNYIQRFCEAQELAAENLEAHAIKRATQGWTEPVFYEGVKVGEKPKYSDSLLAKLLDGAMPQKYKQRYEHSGDPENPVVASFDLSTLSDDELRGLGKLLDETEEGNGQQKP